MALTGDVAQAEDIDAEHRRDRGAAEELEPHSVTNSAAISAAMLAATVLAGCSLGNTDDEAVVLAGCSLGNTDDEAVVLAGCSLGNTDDEAVVLAGCSLGNTDDEAVGRSAACPSWQLTADAGWSDSA